MKTVHAGDSIGIFLRIKTDTKTDKVLCQRTIYSRDHLKNACILNSAIITQSDFVSVSAINRISGIKYFYLQLSPNGLKKLQMVLTTIPDAELILVVNDALVGTFNNLDQLKTRNIQITGGINSPDVDWIHDALSSALRLKK